MVLLPNAGMELKGTKGMPVYTPFGISTMLSNVYIVNLFNTTDIQKSFCLVFYFPALLSLSHILKIH